MENTNTYLFNYVNTVLANVYLALLRRFEIAPKPRSKMFMSTLPMAYE